MPTFVVLLVGDGRVYRQEHGHQLEGIFAVPTRNGWDEINPYQLVSFAAEVRTWGSGTYLTSLHSTWSGF
jgi:hypothetical protein